MVGPTRLVFQFLRQLTFAACIEIVNVWAKDEQRRGFVYRKPFFFHIFEPSLVELIILRSISNL